LAVLPENGFVCGTCQKSYPAILEHIFDLRDAARASEDAQPLAENKIVQLMLEAYPNADYAELVRIRVENAPTYHNLRGHEVPYILSMQQRGSEMIAMFHQRLEEFYPSWGRNVALDIGCGGGASLINLARQYPMVIGVDPSLPDLILAHKALEMAGVKNFQLVLAYGQNIPYPDNCIDYINALNVLEHVFEIDDVLIECHRLLRPGGVMAADSRNRYDLFFLEPHVKLRWVGFIPRRWQKAYVRFRLNVAYETTRLLSLNEVKKGLHQSFGAGGQVVFPYIKAYGGPAKLDAWLKNFHRVPFFSTLALMFFPSHLLIAQKRQAND
jgi:ubiquinone/menaquinone biosynthesis C-methylase UbiE